LSITGRPDIGGEKRRKRWADHVARIGDKRNACRFSIENTKKTGYLEDLVVDGRLT
jgi:hypothetical protein